MPLTACRALTGLGPSLSQLNTCLLDTGSPKALLAYLSAATLAIDASAALAGLVSMESAAAARLASQCAPLLLGCGAAALRLQPWPGLQATRTKSSYVAMMLIGLQQIFRLAQKATVPGDKEAFLRHAPPAQVMHLLRAALSATPAQQEHPGEGAVHAATRMAGVSADCSKHISAVALQL